MPGPVIELFDGERMRTWAEIEREAIILAARIYSGNMMMVARSMRIGRSTLYRKIQDMPEEARARLTGADAIRSAPS